MNTTLVSTCENAPANNKFERLEKSNYYHIFFSSIMDIPRDQWNSIWPNPNESYDFYLSQEKANIPNFEFSYLAIYRGEKPVLLAPLFIADFNLSLSLKGNGARIVLGIQKMFPRFLVIRTLFGGSPVSTNGVIAIDPDHARHPDLLALFDKAVYGLAKKSRAKMIVIKDLFDSDMQLLNPLRTRGYFEADSYPTAFLKIDFSTLDEYLTRLSHTTRKDLRRKIRQTQSLGGIKVDVVKSIDDCADEIFQLYQNVYNKNDGHFEHLTKDFFTNFCHYMPEEARFFLYRVDNKLIGFNFCLVQGEVLADKYLGFDYSVSRHYNLYFISFLHNIEWCLKNGKKKYLLSQGGYETKSRLGAEIVPLRGLVKIVHPLVEGFTRWIK